MDTIIDLLPFFSFFLSCIALALAGAAVNMVTDDIKLMEEMLDNAAELVKQSKELRHELDKK